MINVLFLLPIVIVLKSASTITVQRRHSNAPPQSPRLFLSAALRHSPHVSMHKSNLDASRSVGSLGRSCKVNYNPPNKLGNWKGLLLLAKGNGAAGEEEGRREEEGSSVVRRSGSINFGREEGIGDRRGHITYTTYSLSQVYCRKKIQK